MGGPNPLTRAFPRYGVALGPGNTLGRGSYAARRTMGLGPAPKGELLLELLPLPRLMRILLELLGILLELLGILLGILPDVLGFTRI